jgi:polyhydroxyalkanoate synthesis regulator protein
MLSQIIRFYGNAMQGMMGSYLEKNIQTFIEIQRRLQEQSMPKFGDNPMLNAEAWTQFVKMQGPTIQGLMSSYLEQSANTFSHVQQLQKQHVLSSATFLRNFGANGRQQAGARLRTNSFKQPQTKTG